MDERGYPVPDAMDPVLTLHVTMTAEDYDYLTQNSTYEVYKPFQSAKLTTKDGQTILTLDSPGRIRPKGQSTLFLAACLDTPTMPFQIEFTSKTNSSQTLFGVEKLYLRHHMGDLSYMRDYAYHRMLARFGLPHLRTRKVLFYVNNNLHGFYTLHEAVDQEYVFARNFPDYNPESFALYKMKSFSLDCGLYPQKNLEKAEQLAVEEPDATPPYSFQRGEHRLEVPELGNFAIDKCLQAFVDRVFDREQVEAALAYQRYDEDCAEMLLEFPW